MLILWAKNQQELLQGLGECTGHLLCTVFLLCRRQIYCKKAQGRRWQEGWIGSLCSTHRWRKRGEHTIPRLTKTRPSSLLTILPFAGCNKCRSTKSWFSHSPVVLCHEYPSQSLQLLQFLANVVLLRRSCWGALQQSLRLRAHAKMHLWQASQLDSQQLDELDHLRKQINTHQAVSLHRTLLFLSLYLSLSPFLLPSLCLFLSGSFSLE